MIKYGQQHLDQSDKLNVLEVLRSEYLTQGPAVSTFEKNVAIEVNALHCVSFNSATSALHGACVALGLSSGDIAWTSPNSFVASANCALYCGAQVDFIDIDPDTYNICINSLEEKLEKAKVNGCLPKVVIAVHFAGQPCDMPRIHDLSKLYGFKIIEDASHSIGATVNGSEIGSCTYSDVTVFSFHPVKIITTGEGGIASCKCAKISQSLSKFRSHGITRDPREMVRNEDEPWYYEQQTLGYNYRLTDIQAALGCSQLNKLDTFISIRRKLVQEYKSQLSSSNFKLPILRPDRTSSWHLYVVLCQDERLRKQKFLEMRASGIGVNVHYIPIHLQPFYKRLGFKRGDFPNAEWYYQRCLTLPLHQDLTASQIESICDVLLHD